MTLKEKLKWTGSSEEWLKSVETSRARIAEYQQDSCYYFHVSTTAWYAVECYVEGNLEKSREAARMVVNAALDYFYGPWRETLQTREGTTGHEAWKSYCLWYEQLMESLPWASALDDWEAVRRIAEYAPEDKLPEAAKAKGETGWGWALITFLRGRPRKEVEHFMQRAESDKARRPKLLCPVLRALLDNDGDRFEREYLAYLAYYRKHEFKRLVSKLLAQDGTTLYHLGRKQGFEVQLPDSFADHIIRFDWILQISQ